MSKDSLLEKIKEDFQPISFSQDETQTGKTRTKPYPGARLIPLSEIIADSNQPRKNFDQAKIQELADSIRISGIIQPIILRPEGETGKYVIIAGERRFRAAKLAGLTEIPCILKELTEQNEILTIQLIENLQKENLTPIEEAQSLKKLLNAGLTQQEVSKKIGKSQSYISQALKILELPPKIIEEAEQINTPKEHLLQIAKHPDPEKLWQEAKEGKTAKEIKAEIKKEKISKGRPKNFTHTIKPKDKTYTIIIHFNKPKAEKHEIREALQEALASL